MKKLLPVPMAEIRLAHWLFDLDRENARECSNLRLGWWFIVPDARFIWRSKNLPYDSSFFNKWKNIA